jgi:hypothetical protein
MPAARRSQPRRPPVRAVERANPPRTGLAATMVRAATSPQAKMVYVVVGTMGLAALAVAIIGPKRIEREVIRPLRGRVGEEAEKLWTESRPLRAQIASLFDTAGEGRERLVRNFQSWIGHFHAS